MATDYTNSPWNRSIAPTALYVAVTPSDSADLPNGVCRGIYAGSSGNLTVVDKGGNTTTFTALATGVIHPIQATRVKSTLTTAGSIVAVY